MNTPTPPAVVNVPAFPVSTADELRGHQDGHTTWQYPGMSLRDYFAAKAMAGMTASFINVMMQDRAAFLNDMSRIAYEIADAMLQERTNA